MQVERGLQTSLTILCVLSATMLGIGQGSLVTPLAMALTAILAALVIDRWRWLNLPRVVGNLAMLIVAILTLVDFLNRDSDSQLIAIGNLLTYVQMILFVQTKNERVYGSLAVFSLLQVVVAALLSMGVTFGLLLLAYLLAAMAVLVFHGAYRDLLRFRPDVPDALPWLVRWLLARWQSPVEPNPPAWKRLLDEKPSVKVTSDWQVLDREFSQGALLRQAVALSIATLMFAIGFFVAAPRSGNASWHRSQRSAMQTVGFSHEVRLSQVGRLLKNQSPVLRVAFFEPRTRKKVEVIGGPYLHGISLTQYSPGSGDASWVPYSPRGAIDALPQPPLTGSTVMQEVVLEPSRERHLFTVHPAFATLRSSSALGVQRNTQRLVSASTDDSDGRQRRFRYVVVTTSLRQGDQATLLPADELLDRSSGLGRSLVRFDSEQLAPLQELADQILAMENANDGSPYVRAQRLEAWFRTSADFVYSLDRSQVQLEEGVDPVVDFATRSRVGHCAYFASALTLMLRSQGIPARLVVGYQGGVYNEVGGYYLMRQDDAHAWVEAYLDPDDVPSSELGPGETAINGCWMRLDPTPVARGRTHTTVDRGVLNQIDDVLDYAQVLWSDHIVGLNRERQRRLIYRPLGTSTDALMNWGKLNWSDPLQTAARTLGVNLPDEEILSSQRWRGTSALAILAILGVAWCVYRFVPKRWRFGRISGNRRKAGAAPVGASIRFYEEWEIILQRLRLQREAPQTAREFSRTAVARLRDLGAPPEVADLAEVVVGGFYRVRFGRHALDNQEREAIETALRRLREIVLPLERRGRSRPRLMHPQTVTLAPSDSSA